MVQQQYNQMAEDYDRRWRHYTHPTLRFLLDWAALHPDEQVLDVGCGMGELERSFSRRVYRSTRPSVNGLASSGD